MAEPTAVSDPPALENPTSAEEAEGFATTTDNGPPKENNSQDVTMAGLEESGAAKSVKLGADPALSLAGNNNNNNNTTASSNNPPTPNRTSTPTGSKETPAPASSSRLDNNSSSRAASAAPTDRTADRVAMPTEAAAHGAPTRQYLNTKVTYHVMEGMKILARERPADPLRVLGEFLLRRDEELKTAAGAAANGTAPAAGGAAAAAAGEGDKDKAKEAGADASAAEQ